MLLDCFHEIRATITKDGSEGVALVEKDYTVSEGGTVLLKNKEAVELVQEVLGHGLGVFHDLPINMSVFQYPTQPGVVRAVVTSVLGAEQDELSIYVRAAPRTPYEWRLAPHFRQYPKLEFSVMSILHMLSASHRTNVFVWGRSGTGKTRALLHIIMTKYAESTPSGVYLDFVGETIAYLQHKMPPSARAALTILSPTESWKDGYVKNQPSKIDTFKGAITTQAPDFVVIQEQRPGVGEIFKTAAAANAPIFATGFVQNTLDAIALHVKEWMPSGDAIIVYTEKDGIDGVYVFSNGSLVAHANKDGAQVTTASPDKGMDWVVREAVKALTPTPSIV